MLLKPASARDADRLTGEPAKPRRSAGRRHHMLPGWERNAWSGRSVRACGHPDEFGQTQLGYATL